MKAKNTYGSWRGIRVKKLKYEEYIYTSYFHIILTVSFKFVKDKLLLQAGHAIRIGLLRASDGGGDGCGEGGCNHSGSGGYMERYIYGAPYIWSALYMERCVYGARYIWSALCMSALYMERAIYGAHYIWGALYMELAIYGARYIWSALYMELAIHGARFIWGALYMERAMERAIHGARYIWSALYIERSI